jgi:hypothetical protein
MEAVTGLAAVARLHERAEPADPHPRRQPLQQHRRRLARVDRLLAAPHRLLQPVGTAQEEVAQVREPLRLPSAISSSSSSIRAVKRTSTSVGEVLLQQPVTAKAVKVGTSWLEPAPRSRGR